MQCISTAVQAAELRDYSVVCGIKQLKYFLLRVYPCIYSRTHLVHPLLRTDVVTHAGPEVYSTSSLHFPTWDSLNGHWTDSMGHMFACRYFRLSPLTQDSCGG